MKIYCRTAGCVSFIELKDGITLATSYTCRLHTRKAPDRLRFQQFQFDDDQVGSGADPRVYERAHQSRKVKSSFPKKGRPRKKAFERIEKILIGHESANEIMEVLKDVQQIGRLGGPDSE